MPFVRVLLVLAVGLLLTGPAANAQQAPSPKPAEARPTAPPRREQRVLTMNLALPPLVARLGEATGLLERSAGKGRRAKSDEPLPEEQVMVIRLVLPKLFDTKPANAPAPATP